MKEKSIKDLSIKIDLFSFLVLSLLLFIPGFFTYFTQIHNLYISFVTYIFIILAAMNTDFFNNERSQAFKQLLKKIVLPTFAIIGTNILISLFLNQNAGIAKSLLSYIVFLIMEISAIIFYLNFSTIEEKTRKNTIILFSICYIFVGFFTFFISNYFGLFNKDVSKQMFFFNEPSHYAFLGSPLILYLFLTLRTSLFSIFFVLTILIAGLWANLTLFLVTMFATSIRLLKNNFIYAIIIGIFFIIFVFIFASGNIEFGNPFIKQAQFKLYNLFYLPKESIRELTVLVYFQGWEYIVSSLKQFSFLGLGFQQMGTVFLESSSQTIMNARGYQLNISGGGFNASKIIVEFGFIGILAILYYLKYVFKFGSLILKKNLSSIDIDDYDDLILYFSFFISFAIPLFIRGTSYFNFSFFTLILSFCFIKDKLSKF